MLFKPPTTEKVPLRFLSALTIIIALLSTSLLNRAPAEQPASENLASENAVYSLADDDAGPKVTRNGEMVAQLLTHSGSKPVIYPLLGPGGVGMTRAYPIAETKPGEKEDHIHHRSFWFTHGDVNGVDFWAEQGAAGKIVQTSLKVLPVDHEGQSVRVQTENEWLNGEGQRLLSDTRTMAFFDAGSMRAIDFEITLRASDGPVAFGDTKEGSFGIRVAGTMKVDAKLGGEIVSSEGLKNSAAWGKPAAWVDYCGPVDGRQVGVAILNHPSSFGFPTRWHVRTYGLFAANPFGVHHFVGGEPTEGVKLAAGESLTLKYRVLLHEGTTEQAGIAAAWREYEKSQ